MSKRSLPTVEDRPFGRDTIMEPELAQRHGSLYVHLAALAIDLDRIVERVDQEPEEDWPFGWEVFLTEFIFLAEIDPEQAPYLALLEDLCTSALEASAGLPGSEAPLGAQLLFAVHDALSRGNLPDSLAPLFSAWEDDGTLAEALDPLWEEPETAAADLAASCLQLEIEPPIAPTTRAILEAIVALESDEDEAPPSDGA